MIQLKVKKLSPTARIPTRATPGSAGLDLYAHLPDGNVEAVYTGRVAAIPTGIAVEIPMGYEGQIRIRSGLAFKHGLMLVNGVGTIDADFTGEVMVGLTAIPAGFAEIIHDDRIAQLIISPVESDAQIVEVDKLSDTERGSGGFGSTGK